MFYMIDLSCMLDMLDVSCIWCFDSFSLFVKLWVQLEQQFLVSDTFRALSHHRPLLIASSRRGVKHCMKVWKRKFDNESLKVKVWKWKRESESVKVWKWKCESESVKVKELKWKCKSESVKVIMWKWKCEIVDPGQPHPQNHCRCSKFIHEGGLNNVTFRRISLCT